MAPLRPLRDTFSKLLVLVAMALCPTSPCLAELQPLGEVQLESTAVASAGLSIVIAGTDLKLSMSSLKATDPATGKSLELQDVTLDDGAGGGFSLDTGFSVDTSTIETLTVDIDTEPVTGRGVIKLSHPMASPYTLTAQHTVLDGHDLGVLTLRNQWWQKTEISLATHIDGTDGVDLALAREGSLGELSLTYNDAGQSLALYGVHWAESASGAAEDPASWSFSGPLRIGDLADNPATIDVVGPAEPAEPYVMLNLPMTGTLRIEEVALGGQSFGPVALDGIQVHSLHISLPTPSL